MSPRPTFVCIGPGRCGTSWLHQLLLGHPQICMSQVKETEYFNTHYERGPAWYESHFRHCEGAVAVGEISNNYYLDPAAIERISAYEPAMRIIVGLRRPADLLTSMYLFGLRRGLELGSIEDALHRPLGPIMGSGYQDRLRRGCTTPSDDATLLEGALLNDRLEMVCRFFPKHQVYLLVFERLRREPEQVAEEVFSFIGVEPGHRPATVDRVVNQAATPRSRAVARLSHRGAFLLRKLRLYGALGFLHRSEILRRVLLKDARDEATRVKKSLKPLTLRKLELEAENLRNRVPVIEELW